VPTSAYLIPFLSHLFIYSNVLYPTAHEEQPSQGKRQQESGTTAKGLNPFFRISSLNAPGSLWVAPPPHKPYSGSAGEGQLELGPGDITVIQPVPKNISGWFSSQKLSQLIIEGNQVNRAWQVRKENRGGPRWLYFLEAGLIHCIKCQLARWLHNRLEQPDNLFFSVDQVSLWLESIWNFYFIVVGKWTEANTCKRAEERILGYLYFKWNVVWVWKDIRAGEGSPFSGQLWNCGSKRRTIFVSSQGKLVVVLPLELRTHSATPLFPVSDNLLYKF